MPTISDLRQQAATIKNATQVGENTATRVGTTFETIADLLEGANVGQGIPSVDLAQLNSLRTPADQTTTNPTVYNVTTLHNLSSTTIKVGTLFIFSDGGRAVVTQILLSNYQVDEGENISSPNASQITMYYRMFNIVQETWSAWTLYAGGGGGGTIDPYPVSGSDNAVASNGVFEGLQKAAPEVNINDIDDLDDFVDMQTGVASTYTIKAYHNLSSTWLRVGVLMVFANQANNTLTQICISNCIVDGGGNLIPNYTTNVMNVFYRFKQFSGNPPEGMTIGVWTTWAKFGDSGYQPDNEDIDLNASDQLQFANKSYDASAFSGLGRVYLRKNIVTLNLTDKYFDGFVDNVLVQDVGTSSTPDAILFDTTRKRFVARVGLSWYLDWSSDEDYNPITGDVNWNYNGNFYRWNGKELAQWDKTINQLTQAMVNTANTIYHIQYDYDLNGQTITLPAGCVLEFDGGSLANGIIVGNNTGIIAGEYQIFSFDRTQHYISGTWNIKRWNVKWFGAVGDGVCTESNGNTIFTGTDNYSAMQAAFDTAYKCSPHSVEIPTGFYRISKGLIMNYTAYNNMEVVGTSYPSNYPEGFNGGAVLLCEGEYGIAVNRMRKAKISNISFIGLNYAFQRANNIGLNNPATGMLLPSGFIGSELGAMSESGIGRYNPYSAIVLDGFVAPATNTSYSEPTLPPYLSISSMYQSGGGNSGVTIEDCNVSGFGVGISQYPSNADANGDYTKIIRCNISNNVYGVAIGNSQSREFVIRESNITNSHTAIITTLIGKQQGRVGTMINNCDFSANINIINSGAQLTATTFKNCTGELLYALGKANILDYSLANVSFEDCYFKIGRPYFSTDDLGIPVYLFEGPVNMRNVSINYEDDGHSEKRICAINLVSIRVRCNIENVKCFAFTASATNRGSYEPPLVVYGNNFNSFYPHNAYGNFKSEMWATYQQEKMWFSFPAPIYTRAGSFTFTGFNATDGTLVMPSNAKVTELAVGDVVVCSAFAGVIIRIESDGTFVVRLTNGFKKKNGVYSLINDNGSVAATPMYMLSRKRYLTLSENYYLRVATHPSDNVITLDHWSNDLAVGMTLFYAEQLPNSIRQDTGALPYITALDSTTKQVTFNRRVSCYPGDYVLSYLCGSDDASVTGFINYMLVSGVKA